MIRFEILGQGTFFHISEGLCKCFPWSRTRCNFHYMFGSLLFHHVAFSLWLEVNPENSSCIFRIFFLMSVFVLLCPALPPLESFSGAGFQNWSRIYWVIDILKHLCELWVLFWVTYWLCNSTMGNYWFLCVTETFRFLYFIILLICLCFSFVLKIHKGLHDLIETGFSLRGTLRFAWRAQWRDVGSMPQTLQCENSSAFRLVVWM